MHSAPLQVDNEVNERKQKKERDGGGKEYCS